MSVEALVLLTIFYLASSRGEEAAQDARWFSQRWRDKCEARREIKSTGQRCKPEDELPKKMPYPVPKHWDWREAKRREDKRADAKRRESERDEAQRRRAEDDREAQRRADEDELRRYRNAERLWHERHRRQRRVSR